MFIIPAPHRLSSRLKTFAASAVMILAVWLSAGAQTPASAPGSTLSDGSVLMLNGSSTYAWVYPNSTLDLQGPMSIEVWAYKDDWVSPAFARTGIVSRTDHATGGFEIAMDPGSSKAVGFVLTNCGSIEMPRSSIAPGWHHFEIGRAHV